MKIKGTFDLNLMGMTLEQWEVLCKGQPYEILHFSDHLRDMTAGWQRVGTVEELIKIGSGWNFQKIFQEPGTYAICYDPNATVVNPVLCESSLKFGESTRPMHHRVITHMQAFDQVRSNSFDAWSEMHHIVAEQFGIDIYKDHNKMSVWIRPHAVSDPLASHLKYTRKYSELMEKQAHAFYHAYSGKMTPANNRDLPDDYLKLMAWRKLDEMRLLKDSKYQVLTNNTTSNIIVV
jgi:hypothetical protein